MHVLQRIKRNIYKHSKGVITMCRCDDICVIEFTMYRCKCGLCKWCEHSNKCFMVYIWKYDFVTYYSEGE